MDSLSSGDISLSFFISSKSNMTAVCLYMKKWIYNLEKLIVLINILIALIGF